MDTVNPFAHPLYVMAKPAGALCNLRCSYCYYLGKSALYAKREEHILTDEMLARFTRQYIEAQTSADVLFTWHGGEPLMRPISFYKKALSYQRAYGYGRRIANSIQTNATLITEKWCEFFRDNGFLVGVSVDGPAQYHDSFRRTSSGAPSFHRVMHGIKLLEHYGVEWNALATVNSANVLHPLEFYHFFKDIGCHYIQFSPIVERTLKRSDPLCLSQGMREGGELTQYSVTAEQWGDFLIALFDEWVREDVGIYFIQIFDSTLALWAGYPSGICTLAPECGHSAAMEYNGDLYSCDHFVFPEYRLGNIRTRTITEMMASEKQKEFAKIKSRLLPNKCRQCRFLFACHGECPKNRFIPAGSGSYMNYLCHGYYRYFTHVAPYMDFMKDLIARRLPPSLVCEAVRKEEIKPGQSKK